MGVSRHSHNFAQNGSGARGRRLGAERRGFNRFGDGHTSFFAKNNLTFLIPEAHVFEGLSELFCSLLFAQLLNRQSISIP